MRLLKQLFVMDTTIGGPALVIRCDEELPRRKREAHHSNLTFLFRE